MKPSDLNNHYSREETLRMVAIIVAVGCAVLGTLVATALICLLS